MIKFTNPRRSAEFSNLPRAAWNWITRLDVEVEKHGFRVIKTSRLGVGPWREPKRSTYAKETCLADRDGKVYIIRSLFVDIIEVMTPDFKTAYFDGEPARFTFDGDREQYEHLNNLLMEATMKARAEACK